MTKKFDQTTFNHERHYGSFEKDANDEGINQRVQVKNGVDSPIPVEIVDDGASGTVINTFNATTSVAKDTLTTIASYTVGVGKTFYLKLIEVSGSNRSEFTITINGADEARKRTYGSKLNEEFDFKNFKVTAGQVILVKAEHNRPTLSDYDVRIVGNEV